MNRSFLFKKNINEMLKMWAKVWGTVSSRYLWSVLHMRAPRHRGAAFRFTPRACARAHPRRTCWHLGSLLEIRFLTRASKLLDNDAVNKIILNTPPNPKSLFETLNSTKFNSIPACIWKKNLKPQIVCPNYSKFNCRIFFAGSSAVLPVRSTRTGKLKKGTPMLLGIW